LLEDVLAQVGCIVIGPTATTESALALIEQEAVDCAILDVKLVDGQVFPVADTLAARGVPFVFATAYQADALGKYARAPHIEKVYDRDELLEAIALMLDRQPSPP
jgi:CheY-like chemotaxis protein